MILILILKVETVVVDPVMKVIGKAFKKEGKAVQAALLALGEADATEAMAQLAAGCPYKLAVPAAPRRSWRRSTPAFRRSERLAALLLPRDHARDHATRRTTRRRAPVSRGLSFTSHPSSRRASGELPDYCLTRG